jgi:hypothetical protein
MRIKPAIIGILFLGLIWGSNFSGVLHAAHEEDSAVHAESHTEITEQKHHNPHEDTSHANAEEHGGSAAGHHGEEHHLWWTFPGYEIVLGILSCIYFALFIIIIPKFFGKEMGEHH